MSLKTPAVPKIHKTTDPLVPQFVFEWHESTKKVFIAEVPGRHEGGQFVPDFGKTVINTVVIAEHCETHAMFYCFCQTFLRGYKKALVDYPNLKESSAVAAVERWKASLMKGEKDD